jgi:hypothetical protein
MTTEIGEGNPSTVQNDFEAFHTVLEIFEAKNSFRSSPTVNKINGRSSRNSSIEPSIYRNEVKQGEAVHEISKTFPEVQVYELEHLFLEIIHSKCISVRKLSKIVEGVFRSLNSIRTTFSPNKIPEA